MLEGWLRRQGGAEMIRIAASRRRVGGEDQRLGSRLDAPDNPYLIPVRVVWMAPERGERRSVGWPDALKPGDPRDPRGLLAQWTRLFHPGRIRLIAGAGAYASELNADYGASGEMDGPAAFVTRRAWRTLDQVERGITGNRYKVPRFVPEAILSRRELRDAVHRFADQTGIDRARALSTTESHLREIAASHSPYVIDLVANAIHSLYRQGYREIRYDRSQVAAIAAEVAVHSLVFLPSHRSNLDRLALQFILWENDLPPNHTAGGVNMDFFPIGPILRRTGVFFIRRSFREDDLYKIVLRAYIDYLVEKRFPLEWYMEGSRSRSGKLLPPRFGLLAYVVDAVRRGKAEDVLLIPVSIAYDHIQDVPGYAREAMREGKERESLSWMVRAVRSLRRRYGNIHVRFAEPVSIAGVLDSIGPGEESIGLQKLAFEVMHRIGRVTPITPVAVVGIALLSSEGAKTADALADDCTRLLSYISDRELPTTEEARTFDVESVKGNLDWLAEHENVSSHEAAGRRVFWLTDEQAIRISYYKNMVAHFFVGRALAELGLRGAGERSPASPGVLAGKLLELRDLLKFEFFFPEKTEYLEEVSAEIAGEVPGWDELLAAAGPDRVLSKMGPPIAHWVLLPILDAYRVVADELESAGYDERRFSKRCLARARLYRIEAGMRPESVSEPLFKSALALARHRELLEDRPGVEGRRQVFAAEVREARDLAALRDQPPSS